ncbi:MAG: nicotinamide mononucleotide transporter [Alloprevotella sp.]|nr:nicotinamide mononucleotide transporter [Alloprevotella sp.]
MLSALATLWQDYGLIALDALGTLIGLIYLYLEYKASVRLWFVSMIMPAIDLFVYFKAGLYADFGMAVYYLLMAVYGWIVWTRKSEQSAQVALPITHIPLRRALWSFGAFIFLWALIYWILVRFTPSTVPMQDSFCNALSIIALWMLARKYVEQWLLWLVVDALLCGLYIYKGVPFHGALYGFYTVMAVAGYRKWLQLMRTEKGAYSV